MTYFYISFASEERGFLGATVVEGKNEKRALRAASRLGLNPGGEAAIFRWPPEDEGNAEMRSMLNRLVGKEELLANGGKRKADLSEELQDRFESEAVFVCEACNAGIPHEH